MPTYPNYYQNPYLEKAMGTLYGYGTDVLEGQIPEFYQSLVTPRSQEFEDVVDLTQARTQRAVDESITRRGISRSGLAPSIVGSAVAETVTPLAYQDYLNTQQNKSMLLGTGLESIGQVSSGALGETGTRNTFNTNVANMKNQYEMFEEKMKQNKKLAEAQMLSDIIGSGLGLAGTIGGAMLGGGGMGVLSSTLPGVAAGVVR